MAGNLTSPPGGAMLPVAADDPRLRWQGVVSLQRTADWVSPWRIPHTAAPLFVAYQGSAAMPYGGRLVFDSDTTMVAGRVEPFTAATLGEPWAAGLEPYLTEATTVDLCCDGELVGSATLAGQEHFQFDHLPKITKRVELWLPQWAFFRLRSIAIDAGASLAQCEDPRPRWVAYGSSVTKVFPPIPHPSQTWTARVAREGHLNHTVLGYRGGGQLEPLFARVVRDLDADFITIETGINVAGQASLGRLAFTHALIGFVQIVREGHPDIPIVVQSSIYAPRFDGPEAQPNALGLTLADIRAEAAEAVGTMRAHGDNKLHYVDGLRIYGAEYAHFSSDGAHPDAEGQQVIARNFLREVVAPCFRA